ncbi:VOC family protein [Paenibacillus mesophilus]|uniref:VOC family protein n=1 Tax=Paenibacillus mesophilus TaxID=2582849 RepID=UPI00110E802B|nr:VOC family protein [Paenibacillus mesophilus]TMV46611.1 VOC family protein [Paenibacillus mesophilus]
MTEPLVKKDIIGVMVYVRNLEQAVNWYCSRLGMDLGANDDHFAEMTVEGKYVMHLFKADDCVPVSKAAFTFDTDDIVRAHRALSDQAVPVDPIRHYGDHSGFTFQDCEGNALMICQYVVR